MNEFSSKLFIHFNTQMTEALTITRLSLNIFFKNFYLDKVIPLINKLFLFNFIKEGYYGGITEVYKPYGKNLIYLDVNSLYPFASLNLMPGTECTYIESLDEQGLDLDKLFGFFYAKVNTNQQYLGLLPLHINNNLIFPNGEYFGIWSSEELKFAKENGFEESHFYQFFGSFDALEQQYFGEMFTHTLEMLEQSPAYGAYSGTEKL